MKLMPTPTADFHSKSFPVCAGRNSGMPLEKSAEESYVLIAYCVADFLHHAMVAFQHALGGGDPQLLQVDQGAVSRGLFEAADEIAHAHAHAARRVFERKGLGEILVHPLLRAGDRVVGMIGL